MSQGDAKVSKGKPGDASGIGRGSVAIAILVGLVASLLFTACPRIDLAMSGLFYFDGQGFILARLLNLDLLRNAFIALFIGFSVLCIAGLIRAVMRRSTFGLEFPHWMFFLACLIVGPGLVANALLKDNWGRARPVQVAEFGGNAVFTPPLWPSRACRRNCSFVSGEASSIFALFFALASALPALRLPLLLAGVGAGFAAGMIRMMMGGHFLSDVIFSGVFMLLVVASLQWLMLRRFAPVFVSGGPLQRWLARRLVSVSAR